MSERRRVRVDERRAKPAPPPAAPAECSCPRLDRAEWHNVESDWSDITFVRASVTAVLGVPFGYDDAKKKLEARATAMGLTVPEDAMILLGQGQFRRQILLEVEGGQPGTRGVFAPGGFAYTRLVDAPWGEMRKRVGDMRDFVTEQYGRKPDHLWVWYLTCRECSHERDFETLLVAHYRE